MFTGVIDTESQQHVSTGFGNVKPPADMIAAARNSLSEAGFDRLMKVVEARGGKEPTPAELCREADFERDGFYRQPDLPPAELQALYQDAYLIAAAKRQLSGDAFKRLMHSIDWRAPTTAELAQAVDAERASH